jgi:hypothetical protein
MSLRLNLGTESKVEVGHDLAVDGSLRVGDYHISAEDMAAMCHYWLTVTNLSGQNDPRLKLVASIKGATIVQGYPDTITGTTHRIEAANPLATDCPVSRMG